METLVQTTLSAAVDATSDTIRVAAVTGISVQNGGRVQTVVMINNELMNVMEVNGLELKVFRGYNGTRSNGHVNGSVVLAGRPVWFVEVDPSGAITPANAIANPLINTITSNQWVSPVDRWIPGMGNPGNSGSPKELAVTAAVASAAGLITPSGPIFHVTGALAVTGFNVPTGFNGGSFAIIPDGAFTWTTATNIAIAGTAVVGKLLIFVFDPITNKWYPSYTA